jgi:hypothetical protein
MGIRSTYEQVRAANGPAQHIACAVWGVVVAGLFVGMAPPCLLLTWAASSFLVLIAVVWLPRIWLKRALLLDFLLSVFVLVEYVTYEEPPRQVYYTMTLSGMTLAQRPVMDHAPIAAWFHSLAIITLCVWSLYLANLVHRQILERKRFFADEL